MRSRAARVVAALLLAALPVPAVLAEEPPASTTEVRYAVLAGTRVADLCRMLQAEGISSPDIFTGIAATADFSRFPFVPPPRPNLNRFEGLFPPGRYALSLGGASRDSLSRQQKIELTRELITRLLEASARRFRHFRSRAGLSLDQSIILASIVEKEAVDGRDYGKIASVFVNRLRSGMPLASCPSVEYFLGYHRPYLLLSDIRIDSPYNLYLHLGLPPTSIAFFSDAAFRSAADPPDTPYRFFVFDWARGRHYFAADYAGHRVNMEKSMRDFVARYGREPMFRKYPGKFYQY
jgi:UPF0755 protein